MRTLSRVTKERTPTAEPLPDVFPVLRDHGIRPRRGTVTMLAGTPGSMKTLFMQWLLVRYQLPTLFFSADTDSRTIATRASAMLTGDTQEHIEAVRHTEDSLFYTEKLAELDFAKWQFESDPTYTDLEMETCGFAEAHGKFPEIIVIDNLMNVVGESEDEWGSMRDTTRALHRLVRITDAALFVLHHMAERRADNTYPNPRSDIQGKVAQLPELILALAFDGQGELKIAPVKNRFGPGDASGRTFVSIYVRPATGQFFNSWHDLQDAS